MSETPLLAWLRANGLSVRLFSDLLERPVKTVEDWAYGRGNPKGENRALVYLLTQLEYYSPNLDQEQLDRAKAVLEMRITRIVEQAMHLLLELEEKLTFLTNGPAWGRELFRSRSDPQKTAILANFLRAMLSEERLENWKMTTRVSRSITRKR